MKEEAERLAEIRTEILLESNLPVKHYYGFLVEKGYLKGKQEASQRLGELERENTQLTNDYDKIFEELNSSRQDVVFLKSQLKEAERLKGCDQSVLLSFAKSLSYKGVRILTSEGAKSEVKNFLTKLKDQ